MAPAVAVAPATLEPSGTPNWAQRSRLIDMSGAPLTRTAPSTSSRSSGEASRWCPARCFNFASTLFAATRTALPAVTAARLW